MEESDDTVALSSIHGTDISKTSTLDTKLKATLPKGRHGKPQTEHTIIPKQRYNSWATHMLEYALLSGNEDEVKHFLQEGADPNELPLHFIQEAVDTSNKDILKLLIDYGADKDNFLRIAVLLQSVEQVKMLLEHGADPNKFDVLRYALRRGNEDMVKTLLEHGADPTMVEDFELHFASMKGDVDVVGKLLKTKMHRKPMKTREGPRYGRKPPSEVCYSCTT